MQENRKKWLTLSVTLASSVSINALAADFVDHSLHGANIMVAAAGEGEGGGVTETDLKTNDIAYLSRLGLIRGHLLVGYELYRQGETDMAITHMKHPRDELYAGLVPAIQYRGGERFDTALSKLADNITSRASQQDVFATYQELENAIKSAEAVVKADLQISLQSIKVLIRTAAEEYAIGVKDGELVNVHEYQDAYGFTQIAKRRLQELPPSIQGQAPKTISKVKALLADTDDLWPNIAPSGNVEGDASRLYGAAARIEISALSL